MYFIYLHVRPQPSPDDAPAKNPHPITMHDPCWHTNTHTRTHNQWPMTTMMITAWGFALIWITLSCKWGYAKPIDDLLSYRPMLPLSRLTYCAYLIHPVTQIVMSFQLKGPVHIQHALVLTIFMGNAIISYMCAFVLSLMFEAPVVRMLKILFGRWVKRERERERESKRMDDVCIVYAMMHSAMMWIYGI